MKWQGFTKRYKQLKYNTKISVEVEMRTSKVIFSPISRQNVSHFQSQQRLMGKLFYEVAASARKGVLLADHQLLVLVRD